MRVIILLMVLLFLAGCDDWFEDWKLIEHTDKYKVYQQYYTDWDSYTGYAFYLETKIVGDSLTFVFWDFKMKEKLTLDEFQGFSERCLKVAIKRYNKEMVLIREKYKIEKYWGDN